MESNRSSTEGRRSSVSSEGDDPSLDNTNVSETGSLSIIVLGASGDLAKKKTFPALFNLYQQVLYYILSFFLLILKIGFVTCSNSRI